MKPKTKHFKHFSVKVYIGELVGDDQFIHQSLTHETCSYRKFTCIPQEFPLSKIIWTPVQHNFKRYRDLGFFEVQRISDFVLVPKLGFGGRIQNEQMKA